MAHLLRFTFAALLLLAVGCTTGQPPSGTQSAPIAASSLRWELHQEIYDELKPGAGSIQISLSDQRLLLRNPQGQVALETDCSSGKDGKETPRGHFRILEKIEDKRSNKYGSYVSKETGEVLVPRSWLEDRPQGSRFLGAPMPYWLRITWAGVGIHVGDFPRGTRTSMGCIRVPAAAQPLLFAKAMVGTSVDIQ